MLDKYKNSIYNIIQMLSAKIVFFMFNIANALESDLI